MKPKEEIETKKNKSYIYFLGKNSILNTKIKEGDEQKEV